MKLISTTMTSILCLNLLVACVGDPEPSTIPAPNIPAGSPNDIDGYASQFLDAIQLASFEKGAEICGYFVQTEDGIVGLTPRVGTAASCDQGYIPDNVVAGYHTHGEYLEDYINEIPSDNDALGAFEYEIDEYVSTPGGRLWRIESDTGDTTMLCDVGCLTADPDFQEDPEIKAEQFYTLEELEALFEPFS